MISDRLYALHVTLLPGTVRARMARPPFLVLGHTGWTGCRQTTSNIKHLSMACELNKGNPNCGMIKLQLGPGVHCTCTACVI